MASRKVPHPEEAAERPSRRTHGTDPATARQQVCVGVIAGPQGVRGAVRLKSFTGIAEDVAAYGPLEDEAGRRVELSLEGAAKGLLIARVAGVETREEAERLRGVRLYLPRSALPATAEDEYYHADLIGLEAVLGDGTPVGRVRAIHDFGAGDTLELARSGAPPLMVPFTRAIVPVVAPSEGRLVLDPPPGLLEDDKP